MNHIVSKMELYRSSITKIADNYSVPIDLISYLLSNTLKSTLGYLKSEKLSITKRNDNYYVQGLLDSNWLDLEFTKEFVQEVKSLKNIYGESTIEFMDNEDNEVYSADIYDALEQFDSAFKYNPLRQKGLGESKSEDLEKTVLNPKTRDLIKVSLGNKEEADSNSKCFFGGNTELRKEFIKENL